MASRTPAQARAQKIYEEKVKEIKIRVPNSYFKIIEERMKEYNSLEPDECKHFTSVNKFVLSILENAMDEPMVSISERKRMDRESENETKSVAYTRKRSSM